MCACTVRIRKYWYCGQMVFKSLDIHAALLILKGHLWFGRNINITIKVLLILCLVNRYKAYFNIKHRDNQRVAVVPWYLPKLGSGTELHVPLWRRKRGIFMVSSSVCHLPMLHSYQYKNISITIVQVSMYGILVSWISWCLYLYAHKSRLNVRDK